MVYYSVRLQILGSATIVYNEEGEIMTLSTFGMLEDDVVNNMLTTGRELSKKIFYLINHKLLAQFCQVCSIHSFCLLGFLDGEPQFSLRSDCGRDFCILLPSVQHRPVQEVQCRKTEEGEGGKGKGRLLSVYQGKTSTSVVQVIIFDEQFGPLGAYCNVWSMFHCGLSGWRSKAFPFRYSFSTRCSC